MRTTLNLNDRLLRRAKQRAVEEGITLTKLIEMALREVLEGRAAISETTTIRELPVVTGKLRPSVDIYDRQRLHDLLDESPQSLPRGAVIAVSGAVAVQAHCGR